MYYMPDFPACQVIFALSLNFPSKQDFPLAADPGENFPQKKGLEFSSPADL
jgi:hypothetical protein